MTLTRIIWHLMSQKKRDMLLSYLPQYQQRQFEKIIKDRAIYPACFNRSESLFIHIPKSAGRSVVRGLYDVQSVEHAPAAWYQELDHEKYDSFFKFTIVRNPWDRVVSAYSYFKKGGSPSSKDDKQWSIFINQFDSFDDFVCNWISPANIMRHALFTPQHTFITDRYGQVSLDFIGRFETLQSDFQTIANKINPSAALPHINQSRSKPYSHYYTEKSKKIIADVFREDISLFDYEFED
jgi:chondroitin 4-sulfotransferase 11